MKKRVLVTSSLLDTWPNKEHPILFLGEWCMKFNQSEELQGRDFKLIDYHWDNRKKYYSNYTYLKKLHERLLTYLTSYLNKVHQVNKSKEYWRILIGPWLGTFTHILFDRWEMLNKAEKEFEISYKISRSKSSAFPPCNMDNFLKQITEDDWNERLYFELAKEKKIKIVYLEREKTKFDKSFFQKKINNLNFLHLRKIFNNSFSFSGRNNDDFFIYSSSLPIKTLALLHIYLGLFPKFWKKNSVEYGLDVKISRSAMDTKFKISNQFEKILINFIPKHIPRAYIEEYEVIQNKLKCLNWPTNPKIIFTATGWESDEIFKFYIAEKKNDGTKLVIGQHGGNYGMSKFSFSEDHEIRICDYFLTWGWKDKRRKVIPGFNFKTKDKFSFFRDKKHAILTLMSLPRMSYHVYSIPVAGQWMNYFNDQCKFIRHLNSFVKINLILRLFPIDFGWEQKLRFKNIFPNILFAKNSSSLTSLFLRTRLHIGTYNATTYLESLYLNIPTVIFWNPKFWELRNSAISDFKSLNKVNIFHSSPVQAANFISKIWNNLDSWWVADETQTILKNFCDKYSKKVSNPASKLSSILINLAKP